MYFFFCNLLIFIYEDNYLQKLELICDALKFFKLNWTDKVCLSHKNCLIKKTEYYS